MGFIKVVGYNFGGFLLQDVLDFSYLSLSFPLCTVELLIYTLKDYWEDSERLWNAGYSAWNTVIPQETVAMIAIIQ